MTVVGVPPVPPVEDEVAMGTRVDVALNGPRRGTRLFIDCHFLLFFYVTFPLGDYFLSGDD